jgi:hypothetical protein
VPNEIADEIEIDFSDDAKLLLLFVAAPKTAEDLIKLEGDSDLRRNPHNEAHKPARRSYDEIDMQYRVKWARKALQALKSPTDKARF